MAPLDQIMTLWSAVNRVSRGGEEIGPDQRVTAYEGLKCMTEWAAGQYGEQDLKGTLAIGKLADLVILDKDLLRVAPMAIRDIKVLETIKEGVTVFPIPSGGHPAPAIVTSDSGKTYSWRSHICDMAHVSTDANREWTLVTLLGRQFKVAQPPTMMISKGWLSIFGGVRHLLCRTCRKAVGQAERDHVLVVSLDFLTMDPTGSIISETGS